MAKHFEDINVNIDQETDDFIKVIAEPFERGHGVTIGNALRRSLLTSIPGSAITSLHIEGVSHEFTNIKGVKEDISDIILNLKDIRFNVISEGPELISINLIYRKFGIQIYQRFKFNSIKIKIKYYKILNKNENRCYNSNFNSHHMVLLCRLNPSKTDIRL